MDIRNQIAATIRRMDGNNNAPARKLAFAIAADLTEDGLVEFIDEYEVIEVIERRNPDKTMGAAALADAIADDLNLNA